MNEPIKITTNEQGSNVVSARELYQYLGYESNKFSRWATSKIIKNEFAIENTDWQGLDINVHGNITKDYALSLDFSKRLSMMARTEKGEQARQYFLDCEKQATKPKTQIEILLGSIQMLAEQEQRLSNVEARLNHIEETRQLALNELNYIERSTNEVPEIGIRLKISQIVRSYSEKTKIPHSDIWRSMYSKMLYSFRFNVNGYKKIHAKESKMDIVERENQLDNLFALVSRELV